MALKLRVPVFDFGAVGRRRRPCVVRPQGGPGTGGELQEGVGRRQVCGIFLSFFFAMCLRACSAMSDSSIPYAALSLPAMSGTYLA
eukprot:3739705-Rhodomonas_salina.1